MPRYSLSFEVPEDVDLEDLAYALMAQLEDYPLKDVLFEKVEPTNLSPLDNPIVFFRNNNQS